MWVWVVGAMEWKVTQIRHGTEVERSKLHYNIGIYLNNLQSTPALLFSLPPLRIVASTIRREIKVE